MDKLQSNYFPEPTSVKLADGVESNEYRLNDDAGTVILISRISPGAVLPSHRHAESQFGLPIFGSFTMRVGDEEKQLASEVDAYYAPPGRPHSAYNHTEEEVIAIDFKRAVTPEEIITAYDPQSAFLSLTDEKVIKTGIKLQFFVGPWFEVMVSALPPGGTMPEHKHANEQIGISITGSYSMTVGDRERPFEFGSVYFAPPFTTHAGVNRTAEEARSLNIFIPPRYNKKPVRRQP